MMPEIIVGDSYGAQFEFADPSPERPNDLSGYSVNPVYPAIGSGRYTDDGQMSAAVAETLLLGDCSREAFADAFVRCFRREVPRMGYSRYLTAAMPTFLTGADLLGGTDRRSVRNGAAMRAGPVGLLPDISDVMAVARAQASVTHDTPEGILSAQAAALMVHALHYGLCGRGALPDFLDEQVPGGWAKPWKGPVRGGGKETVHAALWAVVDHGSSLAAVLRESVAVTGDVDTLAAIAMAAASADASAARDIPQVLFDGLEDGEYGLGYMQSLDRRLMEAFPAPGVPGPCGRPGGRR